MNPQPPVTNMRTAPDSSVNAGVKQHASREAHQGTQGPQGTQNEAGKQVLYAIFVVHTQLFLGRFRLGLLINFSEAHLKNNIKRLVNGQLGRTETSDIAW